MVGSAEGATGWLRDPVTRRGMLVGVMTLVMLIPLSMVHGIVLERFARQQSVVADIASTFGGAQDIVGPILVLPYTQTSTVEERFADGYGNTQSRERVTTRERELRLLPQELALDLSISGEHRRRGIYRVLANSTALRATGQFSFHEAARLVEDETITVHWARAHLAVGLSHPRAIAEVSVVEVNGQTLTPVPGTRLGEALAAGFHVPVDATDLPTSPLAFDLALQFNGLGAVRFAPVGAETAATVDSPWPHPSFVGQALPREYRTDSSGFDARWEIPQLARSYPQAWLPHLEDPNLREFMAGVSLFEPVSIYTRVSRSVKYGVLFVLSTFLVLLSLELLLGRLLHVAQYALVGVSLTLFFLVLLSLAETVGFALAYTFASATTVLMTASYAGAALHSRRIALAIGSLLAAAYALLYGLLQLEDLALLMGTGVLLLALGVLMMLTRGLSR